MCMYLATCSLHAHYLGILIAVFYQRLIRTPLTCETESSEFNCDSKQYYCDRIISIIKSPTTNSALLLINLFTSGLIYIIKRPSKNSYYTDTVNDHFIKVQVVLLQSHISNLLVGFSFHMQYSISQQYSVLYTAQMP